ncbi:putative N-acetylglucosaminyl phosphatidylinositol deacetylase family protein [Octadecabacter antarcticus 307]|uniref:Putative N-acetylglucosaminyl phosphatidylinositol deacetylase family protein n=1 Tax=Octadecabacter antarcticus 307 TaxID=391626 RepID=M9RBT0_9RHOB|nr:PIG-L family deacetylase [Octadecabacter antarcticus]AGI69637.1 putative N-acetylglucosaminyl phosphatidylinositol deacetylase family protein [Octadecabacter antarcticus 307]
MPQFVPLSDQVKIANERDRPRIVALWQALTALKSTVSFMNTGAHPDDEDSAMLAALRFRDGVDISYACSTRGEGGQNDIGTEVAASLGTLRTAEMEAASDRLDLRMYWLSVSPDDPITDFGFSKSGVETLAKWGRARTLARFVDIIRMERPDIICPTFLDVPGQHGHHRAMTQAAHDVMSLAADPEYDASDLAAWQVKKLYLPAVSGAGQAYDDDLPPPPATLVIPVRGRDPVTGWSYARIGQQSRAMHATQAMGRWVRAGDETDSPLHLAQSFVQGPDDGLASGLAATLRDLAVPEISGDVTAAQDACDAALAAFPDARAVLTHACAALQAVRGAILNCPPAAWPDIGHKLRRKDQQLIRVIHLSAGVDVHGWLEDDILRPDDATTWDSEVCVDAGQVTVMPKVPTGWAIDGPHIRLGADAAVSDPYPAIYLPDLPRAPCMDVAIKIHGINAVRSVSFDVSPIVLPQCSAALSPVADVINLSKDRRSFTLQVSEISPASAKVGLTLPQGWTFTQRDGALKVTVPDDVQAGLYGLALTLDGQEAPSVSHIRRDPIAPRVLVRRATAQIRVVAAALPQVRVGYIGGGNDSVGHWLDRMGVPVTDLSEAVLSDGALAQCDTLVVGIFAMKFRAWLADAMPRIHDWVREGGTLVTLYHRPWDNWNPDATAPYKLEIGQPSLRWRVTDENAAVTILAPDHPLLRGPNKIGAADWADWHKERGLYFAKDWDAAYVALVAMNDADEAPLKGAILAADVGKGRHVHTSLILHHQMEKLTPGAFRIMANLLARRG